MLILVFEKNIIVFFVYYYLLFDWDAKSGIDDGPVSPIRRRYALESPSRKNVFVYTSSSFGLSPLRTRVISEKSTCCVLYLVCVVSAWFCRTVQISITLDLNFKFFPRKRSRSSFKYATEKNKRTNKHQFLLYCTIQKEVSHHTSRGTNTTRPANDFFPINLFIIFLRAIKKQYK